MARTAMAKKRKRSSFIGFLLVAIVVALITIIIGIQKSAVKAKYDVYNAEDQALEAQIEEQMARAEEIDK